MPTITTASTTASTGTSFATTSWPARSRPLPVNRLINFKVGDFVFYPDGKTKHIGKIVAINKGTNSYHIQFDDSFRKRFGVTSLYTQFNDLHVRYSGPPLTKEEKLYLKCKKLWNNSKWVQNNPSQAY